MPNNSAATPHSGLVSTLHAKFSSFAKVTAHLTGHPATFLLAVVVIVVWALTGPIFHYSDTWQLVINTGTTIVTFLMVFLIQNTQNRDTLSLQLKLSELVLGIKGAKDSYAALDDLSDEQLEKLHEDCRHRATTVGHIRRRRHAARRIKSPKSRR
ncbi:MAG: low affinity iron permease family protein [Pseudolabrys sp.]